MCYVPFWRCMCMCICIYMVWHSVYDQQFASSYYTGSESAFFAAKATQILFARYLVDDNSLTSIKDAFMWGSIEVCVTPSLYSATLMLMYDACMGLLVSQSFGVTRLKFQLHCRNSLLLPARLSCSHLPFSVGCKLRVQLCYIFVSAVDQEILEWFLSWRYCGCINKISSGSGELRENLICHLSDARGRNWSKVFFLHVSAGKAKWQMMAVKLIIFQMLGHMVTVCFHWNGGCVATVYKLLVWCDWTGPFFQVMCISLAYITSFVWFRWTGVVWSLRKRSCWCYWRLEWTAARRYHSSCPGNSLKSENFLYDVIFSKLG